MNFKIEKEDLREWMETVHKKSLSEGWEFAGYYYNYVKVHKQYEKGECKVNSCGYKYKSLHPNQYNIVDYNFFKSRGYPLDV